MSPLVAGSETVSEGLADGEEEDVALGVADCVGVAEGVGDCVGVVDGVGVGDGDVVEAGLSAESGSPAAFAYESLPRNVPAAAVSVVPRSFRSWLVGAATLASVTSCCLAPPSETRSAVRVPAALSYWKSDISRTKPCSVDLAVRVPLKVRCRAWLVVS